MKINREEVHNKYNGHCAYCGKEITIKSMQVDHIIPKKLDGSDEIGNLNPSCRSCNHYKRSFDLETFRRYMQGLHTRLQNDYITKIAIRYGVAKIVPFDGVFYFEKENK